MRDLSKLLWCDLEDNAERIEFLRSGRAHTTGIIAQAMVDEIAGTYELLQNVQDAYEASAREIGYLEKELATLRAKAEAYDNGKEAWAVFNKEGNRVSNVWGYYEAAVRDWSNIFDRCGYYRNSWGTAKQQGYTCRKVRVCKEVENV